jgi:hypothetical protein
MKRTASARRKSSVSGTSTEARRRRRSRLPRSARFVVCVENNGYEASLERNKIYLVLPDAEAEASGDLRVVDESGEDYLFAAKRFVAVDLPDAVQASVKRAS